MKENLKTASNILSDDVKMVWKSLEREQSFKAADEIMSSVEEVGFFLKSQNEATLEIHESNVMLAVEFIDPEQSDNPVSFLWRKCKSFSDMGARADSSHFLCLVS